MTTTTEPVDRVVSTWDGTVEVRTRIAGEGPALLSLHPAAGLAWDPFLDRLAESYTVYAPEFPGTTPGDPDAVHRVDDVWDAVLIYEQLVRELGLVGAPVVGASFGGMLAAELAATYPSLFSRLVLLDPVGLWRDDVPVANWLACPPEELPGLLFGDPSGPVAQAALTLPDDPEVRAAIQAQLAHNMQATGKLCWPVHDRGLRRRLHRIEAPTLVVWGEHDRLVPAVYAEQFRHHIRHCRVEIVSDAGHAPHLEQIDTTFALVAGFLTGTAS